MEASSCTLELDVSTNNFFLRLPAPHENIALTCPRLEDANDIPPIINDDRVYPWMGLPHPHQREHALRWLKSVKGRCDSGQEDLRGAGRERATSRWVSECPVRIIREIKTAHEFVYLGDCGISRWKFYDILNERQRQLLCEENERKVAGDPSIVWSIGYYLNPSHSDRGIMNAAIRTLMRWAISNMNVQHMKTTAMEGNERSIKVLEKNGFTVQTMLPEVTWKGEERVGLQVLEWKSDI